MERELKRMERAARWTDFVVDLLLTLAVIVVFDILARSYSVPLSELLGAGCLFMLIRRRNA